MRWRFDIQHARNEIAQGHAKRTAQTHARAITQRSSEYIDPSFHHISASFDLLVDRFRDPLIVSAGDRRSEGVFGDAVQVDQGGQEAAFSRIRQKLFGERGGAFGRERLWRGDPARD